MSTLTGIIGKKLTVARARWAELGYDPDNFWGDGSIGKMFALIAEPA